MSLNESENKLVELNLEEEEEKFEEDYKSEFQIKRQEFDAKFTSRITMYLNEIETKKKRFVEKADCANIMFNYIKDNLNNFVSYNLVRTYRKLLIALNKKIEELLDKHNMKKFDTNNFDEYNSIVKSRELCRTLKSIKEDTLFNFILDNDCIVDYLIV